MTSLSIIPAALVFLTASPAFEPVPRAPRPMPPSAEISLMVGPDQPRGRGQNHNSLNHEGRRAERARNLRATPWRRR